MNVRFLVLTFLERHPAHGYAIRRWLHVTGAATWGDVKPYSIHHAISTLEGESMVARRDDLSTSRRRVVEITPEGLRELERLRAEIWAEPLHAMPEQLYTLLNFPGPTADVMRARALAAAARTRDTILGWEAEHGSGVGLPPVWAAMYENGLEHLRADLRLLERVGHLSDAELLAAAPDADGEVPGVNP